MSCCPERRILALASAICAVTLTLGAQPVEPRVAAGRGHGVLLKADGSVWNWGVFAGEPEPAPVEGIDGVAAIAAGDSFTLAARRDGTVWGWGHNEYGELGQSAPGETPQPARIAGIDSVVALAVNGQHALALRSDGSVWEWGKLPIGKDTAVPHAVEQLSAVIAIAAGERHSVALRRDGTVWVWGFHGAGDLGNGNYGLAGLPLAVPGFAGMVAVAAGEDFTLALKRDGTVWALGYGAAGQMGNGALENANRPVRVVGLAEVKALAAGSMHALALKLDGTVWSWGYNHSHQLGNLAVGAEESPKPVRSGTLSGVVAIAAAANHSAALTAAGEAWGWGDNDSGWLGVDEEDLRRSDLPMRIGTPIPPECNPLFACLATNGKVIRICGVQSDSDTDKWSSIQYRYGPEYGPPELAYPADPGSGPPRLFFSHEQARGDYRVTVRFVSGGYTYRVFERSKSGAGVAVTGPGGTAAVTIECGEAPALFAEYLRMNLPCDPLNAHGAAACRAEPVGVR